LLVDAASCQFLLVQRHIDPVTRPRSAARPVLVVPVVRYVAGHWLSLQKSRTLAAMTRTGRRGCHNYVVIATGFAAARATKSVS
jgi:hypothetical protein